MVCTPLFGTQVFRRTWKSARSGCTNPTTTIAGSRPGGRSPRIPPRALRMEALELRTMLAANVVISEFLAANDNDILDEDRRGRPDWIEVLNAGDEAVDLEGWSLTDDPEELGKWHFPAMDLEPGKRLVVFASAKDRAMAGSPLHTNFKLDDRGEYLALVEPDGMTVAYAFGDAYPPQVRDVSFGMLQEVHELNLHTLGNAARVLIPASDELGLRWTEVDFDDTAWIDGATGVGYSFRSEFDELVQTNVKAEMKSVNASAYVRLPFQVEDISDIVSLTLSIQYKDGYVAFLNGVEVARSNAPDDLAWNSTAKKSRAVEESLVAEERDLAPFVHVLNAGANVLAIQGLNSSAQNSRFLIAPQLTGLAAGAVQIHSLNYFPHPTAAAPNGTGWTAAVTSVAHTPRVPGAGDALTVTAEIHSTGGGIATVTLYHRVMFEHEYSMPMADDGLHGDGAAGDGVYGATIPADTALPGEMIRYRITAGNASDALARSPVFQDPLMTSEYWGTIVADPAIESNLPVMHLFLEDPEAADTIEGSRGALYYHGEFYDNILSDLHGLTTRGFPKKSHDVFMPRDHKFLIDDGLPRLDDINLMTNYGDPTLLRSTLAYEIYNQIGSPAHLAFPIRVEQNGEFFGIVDFVEDGDDEFLARLGLDPRGALYRIEGTLVSAEGGFEKKTRTDEDNSDLAALVEGLALPEPELQAFLFDNISIPEMVNFAVGIVVTAQVAGDGGEYYAYQDTEGTGLWHLMRWDVDTTFGRRGTFDPDRFRFRFELGRLFTGAGNALLKGLFGIPEFESMYLRRLRTVMDELLQPPDTPADQLYLNQRIDALAKQLRPDVPAEFDAWPTRGEFSTWEEQLDLFKHEYFPRRRVFLYGLVGDMDFSGKVDPDDIDDFVLGLSDPAAYEAQYGVHPSLRGDTDFDIGRLDPNQPTEIIYDRSMDLDFDDIARFVELVKGTTPQHAAPIPAAQIGAPEIQFGQIDSNPVSGNQDEEFIELKNPLDVAVDISGWRLEGGVRYTFKLGVVIPPGGSLYVSPNFNAFRARQTEPFGGQGLFVQGDYSGRISNLGATIRLVARDGTEVARVMTPSEPSPAQAHLRISELMYHPPAVATSSAFEDEDFEFVELVNTSDSMTLDLENVAFTQGIEFSFPSLSLAAGEHVVLVRNAAAFADRYGGDILVAGEYGALPNDFKLSNGGERLVLVDAAGGLIHDFYYDDAWYPETDGAGRSLEIADPAATEWNLWGIKASWLPSAQAGGTPGDARSASVAARAISDLPVLPSELRNDAVRARVARVAESRWIKTVDLALRGNLHGRRVPRTVATYRAPHWEGGMSTMVDTAKADIG